MGLQINGSTPIRVRVNGSDVDEVHKNGMKVWPEANGAITAGVSGGSTYGYLSSKSPNNGGSTVGSISGDFFISGVEIIRITWGFNLFVLEVNSEVSSGFFDSIRIETEVGEKIYTSSNGSPSAQDGYTQWTWSENNKLFNNGISYGFVFV